MSYVNFLITLMTVQEFQKLIEEIYYDQDAARGVEGTFVWFTEEVGELAKEIRRDPRQTQRLREEFADVFAWLSTLASLLGIDLQEAIEIYAEGCPEMPIYTLRLSAKYRRKRKGNCLGWDLRSNRNRFGRQGITPCRALAVAIGRSLLLGL